MDPATSNIKALGISSGGLDSLLAAALLRRQKVTVHWLSFETPFFSAQKARDGAAALNIPLRVQDITESYLPMLKNPPCGYGRHLNPCLDCHALMARLAGRIMAAEGYAFVFTGEVMGQRPMSQTKSALRYVEKHSGLAGYLLRPLSARLLPETQPEKNGLVDRRQLGEISGRSRQPQMALAQELGIDNYPSPAGGCLLTEEVFSRRLADLFAHQDTYAVNEFHLLRFGRHFRLSQTAKLIVGRNQSDNQNLLAHQDCPACAILNLKDHPGPTALLLGPATEGERLLAAGICAGYSKAPPNEPTAIRLTCGTQTQTLKMMPIPGDSIGHLLI